MFREPDAVVLHVRIYGGPAAQAAGLPATAARLKVHEDPLTRDPSLTEDPPGVLDHRGHPDEDHRDIGAGQALVAGPLLDEARGAGPAEGGHPEDDLEVDAQRPPAVEIFAEREVGGGEDPVEDVEIGDPSGADEGLDDGAGRRDPRAVDEDHHGAAQGALKGEALALGVGDLDEVAGEGRGEGQGGVPLGLDEEHQGLAGEARDGQEDRSLLADAHLQELAGALVAGRGLVELEPDQALSVGAGLYEDEVVHGAAAFAVPEATA